jgi:hypothetical protein
MAVGIQIESIAMPLIGPVAVVFDKPPATASTALAMIEG